MHALMRFAAFVLLLLATSRPAAAEPPDWSREWPRTDFSKTAVPFEDIISGGPSKDGIPAIEDPQFARVTNADALSRHDPVISVQSGGEAHAYPLRILIWHEIVNDSLNEMPIAVTFCPLCNSAVVFDRRVDARILSFGTTGKLRYSDLIMYDRQTESWWQQFLGECILGQLVGRKLSLIPSRVESFERFQQRYPNGKVLLPPRDSGRAYGTNPYPGYDRASKPFLYRGHYSDRIPPLARVVVVGDEAWTLDLLMRRWRIEAGDLVLTWEPGQASPLDSATIDAGRDIGNVLAQRRTAAGLDDTVYDVSFAFAFRAFHPNAPIHDE
jgi:hypothetical protein